MIVWWSGMWKHDTRELRTVSDVSGRAELVPANGVTSVTEHRPSLFHPHSERHSTCICIEVDQRRRFAMIGNVHPATTIDHMYQIEYHHSFDKQAQAMTAHSKQFVESLQTASMHGKITLVGRVSCAIGFIQWHSTQKSLVFGTDSAISAVQRHVKREVSFQCSILAQGSLLNSGRKARELTASPRARGQPCYATLFLSPTAHYRHFTTVSAQHKYSGWRTTWPSL